MFKKVKAGEKVQLGETWINGVSNLLNNPTPVRQNTITGNNDSGIILVKNVSGSFVEANGVLGVGDSIITPDSSMEFRFDGPTFEGKLPDVNLHFGKFCVLSKELDINELGLAWIGGIRGCKINIVDAGDIYADIKNGDSTSLESNYGGTVRILDRESGVGVKWARISFSVGSDFGSSIDPTVLASTGESANTDTWDITAQAAGKDGVQWVAFRIFWSGVSGEPIYQYIRTPTYDSHGRLVAVSVEARSTAFATAACS